MTGPEDTPQDTPVIEVGPEDTPQDTPVIEAGPEDTTGHPSDQGRS